MSSRSAVDERIPLLSFSKPTQPVRFDY